MADISIYAISCFYFVSAYLTIEEKSYTGKITAERFIYFTWSTESDLIVKKNINNKK